MSKRTPSKGEPQHPTIRGELDAIWRAIADLQAPTAEDPDRVEYRRQEVVFSYYGWPDANDISPVYRVQVPTAYITAVQVSLRVGPSGSPDNIDINVRVNGSTVTTVTYDHSDEDGDLTTIVDTLMLKVEEWDAITVQTGATINGYIRDITVQMTLMIPVDGE